MATFTYNKLKLNQKCSKIKCTGECCLYVNTKYFAFLFLYALNMIQLPIANKKKNASNSNPKNVDYACGKTITKASSALSFTNGSITQFRTVQLYFIKPILYCMFMQWTSCCYYTMYRPSYIWL